MRAARLSSIVTRMDRIDTTAFDRFEAAGWDVRAACYDRFFVGLTGRVVEPLLDAAGITAGQAVADVGSGPGHVAAACAARGADVTGSDVASEMVALARRRHPGIRFEQADAQRLPFAAGTMDAVVGNFVILHIGHPETAAGEAARVLRPGGRLALSAWDTPDRCRLVGVLVDAVREVGAVAAPDIPDGPPFFRFADEGEFTRLLTGAGFTGVQVRTVAFEHPMADSAELWRGLMEGTVRSRALVLSQPEGVQARIRSVFERLASAYATPHGIALPVSAKIASGVRP